MSRLVKVPDCTAFREVHNESTDFTDEEVNLVGSYSPFGINFTLFAFECCSMT